VIYQNNNKNVWHKFTANDFFKYSITVTIKTKVDYIRLSEI